MKHLAASGQAFVARVVMLSGTLSAAMSLQAVRETRIVQVRGWQTGPVRAPPRGVSIPRSPVVRQIKYKLLHSKLSSIAQRRPSTLTSVSCCRAACGEVSEISINDVAP